MIDPAATYPILLPDGTPHKGTVFLARVIDHPQFAVGDFTYASDFDPPDDWATHLAPYLFPFSTERLTIGRFCQIAHGVRFITASASHDASGISTFPFPVFDAESRDGYQPDRRDTVIGHDVWLGYGALVMPGARIGNGVIVGAGSVVRGTLPDYCIATGNPAVVTRMRFEPDEITRLNALAWWDWPVDRITASQDALLSADIAALIRQAQDSAT
ncbi:CatB-related O-acetyltransferase [Roseobacter ponti]|uniref:CatB-related O-acetyltransferase n=1 Tax=Roseobacter ponti TaxID=1891787 RepID=A0A858SYH8_9RHOB|nr:CatB-related O-acetyltransferase [Roseobacter ponti]QJF53117.1 CatB-related O-acetyltransferase [Roseobacter ponti]